MTAPIRPVSSEIPEARSLERPARDGRLHQAALDFEAMFVRQLLSAAKIAGKSEGPHAGMAVDALASGISKGGGLGLAHSIEESISRVIRADERSR